MQSFNKQSLFGGNLIKNNQTYDSILTKLIFIGVLQCLAVLRSCELFVSEKLYLSRLPFLSFSFFF